MNSKANVAFSSFRLLSFISDDREIDKTHRKIEKAFQFLGIPEKFWFQFFMCSIFSRVHATLLAALSVRPLVGPSIGPSLIPGSTDLWQLALLGS